MAHSMVLYVNVMKDTAMVIVGLLVLLTQVEKCVVEEGFVMLTQVENACVIVGMQVWIARKLSLGALETAVLVMVVGDVATRSVNVL